MAAEASLKANLEKALTGVVSKVLTNINRHSDSEDDDFVDTPRSSGSLRKPKRLIILEHDSSMFLRGKWNVHPMHLVWMGDSLACPLNGKNAKGLVTLPASLA